MKVKLDKLSICSCGYPALDESIPIGTEYEIEETMTQPFTWRCGGCGELQHIIGVWVCSRNGGKPGYLPIELFEKTEGDGKELAV